MRFFLFHFYDNIRSFTNQLMFWDGLIPKFQFLFIFHQTMQNHSWGQLAQRKNSGFVKLLFFGLSFAVGQRQSIIGNKIPCHNQLCWLSCWIDLIIVYLIHGNCWKLYSSIMCFIHRLLVWICPRQLHWHVVQTNKNLSVGLPPC